MSPVQFGQVSTVTVRQRTATGPGSRQLMPIPRRATRVGITVAGMVRPRRLVPVAAALLVAAAVAIPLAVADDLGPASETDAVAEVADTASTAPLAPLAPGVLYVALGASYTSAPGVTPM